MFVSNVALVSQTEHVPLSELSKVSAAIQKQVVRDFKRSWNVDATVSAFADLADVPLGYWHVVVRDDIEFDAAGIHLNEKNGQPFALVQFSPEWSLTASHETLEMLADPYGRRVIAGASVEPGQGRVEYLVEVCDPCEAADFGYTVNGVLVSDFYLPSYFDPQGTRDEGPYSFRGNLEEPRQVLEGGYLSWREPESGHLFQLFVDQGKREFKDQGPIPPDFSSLRELSDRLANRRRAAGGPERLRTAYALRGRSGGDLQSQIDALVHGSRERAA